MIGQSILGLGLENLNNMKVAEKEHNDILYRFEFYEQSNIIDIYKENILTYKINVSKHNKILCNCPGFIYHRRCWHSIYALIVLMSKSIKEPWAEWAEDFKLESEYR